MIEACSKCGQVFHDAYSLEAHTCPGDRRDLVNFANNGGDVTNLLKLKLAVQAYVIHRNYCSSCLPGGSCECELATDLYDKMVEALQ